jgi:putative ABC transport system permease protein
MDARVGHHVAVPGSRREGETVMASLRRFRARLREWLWRGRTEREIGDEIRSDLDLRTADYERRGLAPAEAHRRALLDLGGVEQTRELVRDARGFRSVDDLVRDTLYAVRLLGRAPGFTLTVVLTLALGIGANTAIFSLVDAVVLRPLPYPEPERLVSIWETLPAQPASPTPDRRRSVVAPANFVDYQARARSFSAMVAFEQSAMTLTGLDTPERLDVQNVSVGYFDVVGLRPSIGRAFAPDDFRWGSHRVTILTHAAWQRLFGGDTAAAGRRIQLNGADHEVIGVMPPDFIAPVDNETPAAVDLLRPLVFGPDDDVLSNRLDHRVDVIGRLAPGVSAAAASAELRIISESIGREFPRAAQQGVELAPLRADQVREVRPQMLGMLAGVGLVLLIACANVAGLVMVRSLAARREIAIRATLGASRGRLIRSLVTQSLVLAVLGAAAGLIVAWWTRDALVALAPPTLIYANSAALDLRVLAFTALLAIATGLVFGILPAWQVSRTRPNEALRDTERVVASRWVLRSRNALLAAEVALSLALLVGAGLMVRSLVALNRVDVGFEPSGVLAANISFPRAAYPTKASELAFFEAAVERLRQTPGIQQAAFATGLPMRGAWTSGFELERGEPRAAGAPMEQAGFQAVSAGYFDTLGIRLLHGRALAHSDRTGAMPVAVVGEAFGRKFLGGKNPIGWRLRRGEKFPWITVVGVVADIRRGGQAASIEPQVYLPAGQTELYPSVLSRIAVKASGDPAPVREALKQAVWAIDRNLPLTGVLTLDETLVLGQAERRFQTFLFGLFAAVAVLLSMVGMYGVVAYAVSQRTAEIGLRLALGARPGQIVAWAVGDAARPLALGTALGIGIAVLLSRAVSSQLFGITPWDTTTYALAGTLLALVALGAAWFAARRATRINPLTALR